MCGRFSITLEAEEIQLKLGLGELPEDWKPRFNVAPSQPVAVVLDPDHRDVHWMMWGLVPFWAKSTGIGSRLINARAETVAEKPAFRQAFQQRRCLILADGFYEWLKPGSQGAASVPYYFHEKHGLPFTFAGLWDRWQDQNGNELQSCTIITCPANKVVQPIHDRMPVILDEKARWEWLAPLANPALQALLRPVDDGFLERYAVSRIVNNPRVDAAECLAPQPGQDSLFQVE
jgi:putative SOS response-associated peptidase YedK